MSRSLALCGATLAILARTAAAEPVKDPPETKHRIARVVGVGIAAGVYVTWEAGLKSSIAPKTCRWCSVPGFDSGVRESLVWKNVSTANTLSNVTGYALSPLGVTGLVLLASAGKDDRWLVIGDDVLAIAEAGMYTQLVVQGFKYSFGRQRPYAHYAPTEYASTSDDNLSFVSGHSALVFSIATSAGVIAHARHYKLEPVVWAVGMTLAATTAYLRIGADKHYFSDVLGGSLLGVAGGLLIPRLTGALPHDTTLVPTGNGVALAGVF